MNKIIDCAVSQIEIKKSIFIASLFPIASIDDAKDKLEKVRKQYNDATHNCFAYIVGEKGEEIKFSDDGEPGGTAGIIIYNALMKSNITNVLCVVTRYFGGILLGSGGLVRAYSEATSEALKKASIEEIKSYKTLTFSFAYSYTTPILNMLNGKEQLSSKYEDKVYLSYNVLEDEYEDICKKLIELTNGTVLIV